MDSLLGSNVTTSLAFREQLLDERYCSVSKSMPACLPPPDRRFPLFRLMFGSDFDTG